MSSPHLTADDVERIKSNPALQQLMVSMLSKRKVNLYAPFLIGAWLDSLFLGLVFILWFRWWAFVRPTDTKWTRILVYYIMLPNLFSSTCLAVHVVRLMNVNFGDYLGFFEMICKLPLMPTARIG